MNDFKQPQMPQFNMDPKKLGRYIAIGVLVVILLVGFIMSWKTVDPGYEGFVNKPYNGGVDASTTYKEGTHFIAPWNEMITYTVLQQSKTYTSTVMDKNGTDITVEVAINFSIQKGNTPTLHLKIGENYIQIIDDKSQGAIKNVIGKYTYEEVYSTKRNVLEGEIRDILIEKFNKNYVNLEYVEIKDVDLPADIAKQIVLKETQKQRNKTAKEKQQEEEFLANARIEKSRGDSSLIVSARYKAEAIKLEAEQIGKNPQYIELKKWESWDGKGSPYGTGNVFGSGVSILKQQ
ncbi:MAG: prohibitin family protein [Crocinitomicaceae bacterium]|jgi:regulator of protease activity HflC (stomatin/prohibitin superfamily)|nr:prohibitin family protein [Crocinitomicaceae bacterium]MDC1385048.1 prohibitin family protein [Crocinitomicaceae bacterium]|tara:strand:- start:2321 stop:3193 length:873 start_codon:yes stop_codon:yes gene_type:complete